VEAGAALTRGRGAHRTPTARGSAQKADRPMQAIETKYLGPTDMRGSRVRAKAEAGSVIVPWDHALSLDENHTRAAQRLATKLGWRGKWVGGTLPSGVRCYVNAGRTFGSDFAVGAEEGEVR
jgi:hypothetical protein